MSRRSRPVLLVVAKVPVPGLAKTRLVPAFGEVGAARLAQAALLDTLDASVAAATRARADVVVALAGRVSEAIDPPGLVRALRTVEVVGQRGSSFAGRLASAHADAAHDRPVLQIGMDTPQVGADLLARLLADLPGAPASEAGLGRAPDGGWWALALPRGAAARCLIGVPMSQSDTADRTVEALVGTGLTLRELPVLHDVDTAADVAGVAALCAGRFGALAGELLRVAS